MLSRWIFGLFLECIIHIFGKCDRGRTPCASVRMFNGFDQQRRRCVISSKTHIGDFMFAFVALSVVETC